MKSWKVNKEELLLSDKWQRVTCKVGNYTYLYFFFILEEEGKTFILNTRTLKCTSIQGINHKIIPLVIDLTRDAFIYKEKDIYKTYKEYICVDNWVLDSEFNQTFIETQYERHPLIMDSLGEYLAAKDFQGIHLFKIITAGHHLKIEELQYFFKEDKDNNKYGLYVNDDFATFSIIKYFDPMKEKFFIDVEGIKEEHKRVKQRIAHESTPYEPYSLIDDGLDGEAEAYWNID